MAQSTRSDWPLKTNKPDFLPGQEEHPMQSRRRLVLCTAAALLTAFVSLVLSIAITARFGKPHHPGLLVAWITVSGGMIWFLGILLLCLLYRSPPTNGRSRLGDDVEMENARWDSRPGNQHATTRSRIRDSIAGSVTSITHFRTRPRTMHQDKPHSRHGLAGAVNGDFLTTPSKPTVPSPNRAREMPREEHPNPLTSSPIFGSSPPLQSPPQTLRHATNFSRSSFSNGSPTPRASAGNHYSYDSSGYSGAPMKIRSASEMELASGTPHGVDVYVTRSTSVSKIVAATVRRGAS